MKNSQESKVKSQGAKGEESVSRESVSRELGVFRFLVSTPDSPLLTNDFLFVIRQD